MEKIGKPIYAEGYGPYNDRFRLKVVDSVPYLGFNKAAKKWGVAESTLRGWSKAYASGPINFVAVRRG